MNNLISRCSLSGVSDGSSLYLLDEPRPCFYPCYWQHFVPLLPAKILPRAVVIVVAMTGFVPWLPATFHSLSGTK
ncbi:MULTISPECIES: hypothetical protein [Aminobacterium]|uniref:hypothetical protein n=1 Tax=Aminobacterium TaxID=81466 RepID=UPI0012EC7183|nr:MULTISPECIES: hypothetical protein [Aminobacterium]